MIRTTRTTRFAFCAIIALMIAEAPASAYLDPGAGSMLLQVLLGGAAAAGVIVRLFWRNITMPFRRKHPGEGPRSRQG